MRRLCSLLILTGCAAAEDAAPPPDSAEPDVALGRASVALTSGGVAAAGVDVIFHDANGAVVHHVKTDALGEASATIAEHAMMTIVRPDAFGPGAADIITVREVADGDRIAMAIAPREDLRAVTTVRIALPGAPVGAGEVRYYHVSAGCGLDYVDAAIGDAAPLAVPGACLDSKGLFSVYVAALDGAGDLLAYAFRSGVEPQKGTTRVRLDAWRTDLTSIEVTGDGVAAGGTAIVSIEPRLAGVRVGPQTEVGTLPMTVRVPSLPYDALALDVHAVTDDGRSSILRRIVPKEQRRIAIESADLLGTIEHTTLDVAEPARPVVRFEIAGNTSGADAVCAAFYWSDRHAMRRWMIFGAPTSEPIRTPSLPDSIAASLIDAPPTSAAVTLFDRGEITSFSALRNDPSEDIGHQGRASSVFVSLNAAR